MIEPTNGAGLSGITGKSAKKGTNGLFSKLLAMLEKQTEASAKGKGLQANATGLSKGKSLQLNATELSKAKVTTIISDKGEALITGKGKAGGKTFAEETATPLISANIIIDPATQQIKKGGKAASVNVLIAEQKSGLKGQTPDTTLKQALLAGGTVAAGKSADTEEAEQPLLLNSKTSALEAKGAALGVQKETKTVASTTDFEQLLSTADKPDKTTTAKVASQAGTELNAQKMSIAGSATTAEQKVAAPLLNEQAKATVTATQSKVSLDEKPDLQQKPETANVLAGAQQQQAKPVQLQQGQNTAVTSASATATAVQTSGSDASLADSGSGSSDKGGQDARNLSALSGDAKSSGSTTSANSNFQSYMTGKATPTMSVFDSMKHIAQSAANGQTKLEIQLDPVNLGKIQITLQTDAAKQLQVHMVVDQNATRTSIEQQLPLLRNALAQQGFDLSGFSMGSNGQQGTSADNSGHSGSGNNTNSGDNVTASNSTNISEQPSGRTADGGLSIRV